VNVGTGSDIAIADLASLVADAVGYRGPILWDTSKPDGTPRKLLDVSRLASLGLASPHTAGMMACDVRLLTTSISWLVGQRFDSDSILNSTLK
jgi:hypothetical protein